MWEEPSRRPIPIRVKRQVYKRAKGKCEKCSIPLAMNEGDFHHTRAPNVTPRASSIRFVCPTCHRKNGHKRITRTLENLLESRKTMEGVGTRYQRPMLITTLFLMIGSLVVKCGM